MKRQLLISHLCVFMASGAEKITLHPDMMTNMSGVRPALELIDEPSLEKPQTSYSNGFVNAPLHYPLAIVFDLATVHKLTEARYFDANGDGGLTIDTWNGKAWVNQSTDDLKSYMQWTKKALDADARYLRLVFQSPASVISEFILFGTPQNEAAPVSKPKPKQQRPLMQTFIGMNGFIDDPIDKLAASGHIREYHSWQWDEGNGDSTYEGYPNNKLAWNPSWVSGPGWGWDFDDYYEKLKSANIIAAPVFQGTAPFIHTQADGKPVSEGADPTTSASYTAHAAYLFQFAARYGATKVSPDLLKLRDGQPVKSGLNLVPFMETWNEPDRTWHGRPGHFQPSELAAMMSADYDGHLNTLGPGIGIKNADPNMQVVMAGLAFPEIEYLKALKLWSDLHRDGSFPADVINIHHYSNDAGGQQGQATKGISPEQDHLREKMSTLVKFRDTHYPEKEIWLSEFGYDTHPASPQRAPAIGQHSAEEVQAWWLMRTYLALAAAGIDRAQMFMLRDVDAALPGKFNTSGLTTSAKAGHKPKPSWHHIKAMRQILTGTHFEKEIPAGRADVLIYRFKSATSNIDVIWCPASENKQINNFTYSPANASAQAELITLPDTTPVPLANASGQLTLTVTECPVFVLLK